MTPLQKHVKSKCEESGQCWDWNGAVQTHGQTPTMRHNGVVGSVRRFLAMDLGKSVEGKVVTQKCGNPMCVAPDHIAVMPRGELQRRISKTMNYKINTVRMKKISDKSRETSKLNEELVEQIRQSNQTQRIIAKAYGVTQATISCIKTGRTWRDYKNPFAAIVGALKR